MQCEIKISENGLIEARTYPNLMDEILRYTNNNIEETKSLYGMALTDEFKSFMDGKKPNIDDLLLFVDYDNSFENKKLNKDDVKLFLDLTLSNIKKENIKDKFLNSFTVNGIFGININSLKKEGIFSNETILKLMNMEDVGKIQTLYYKLKNNNDEFENVATPFTINIDDLSKVNPDIYLTSVYNNYIGLSTRDEILNKASEVQDEVVLNNPNLITNIIDNIDNKQQLIQYEVNYDENGLNFNIKKSNNTNIKLQQTLDVNQNFDDLLFRLDNLLKEKDYNSEYISKDILSLEDLFSKKGIDIEGFSELLPYKTTTEVQNFLSSLFNFIYDANLKNDVVSISESLSNYSENYDSFFGNIENIEKSTIDKIDKDGVYMNIETNFDEESLFKSKSIIRYKNNIYQKIKDNKSLDDLYELIYLNSNLLPKDAYSVEVKDSNKNIIKDDIDVYISEKSKILLNIGSDVDVLKKITAYKILNGSDITFGDMNINKSYLKNDYINPNKFIIEFNKTILNNKNLKNIFYFSNRGLESRIVIGDYTKMLLKQQLSDKQYDDLQQYALLSGNESLKNLIPEYDILDTKDNNILRNFYANNMHLLNEVNNPYKLIDTTAIIENITDSFVKIKGELYERLQPNVYELVDIVDSRYKNYKLSKPKLSLSNIEDYVSNIDNSRDDIKIKKNNKIENEEIEFC